MSFANQFLSLCRLAANANTMDVAVHDISLEQDLDLAQTKLIAEEIYIDSLSSDQIAYRDSYNEGT
ncbi:MAG TPA: adenosylhomocysteinase, partial [Candidatus Thalassarchaeaceae archaeon]|nr:MAG TPA: hypothetical protein D7H94_01755 [Candidatus Poseidoniales archaeon]HIH84115.1 adenosylhomocysteinase [Candidatus Thalassarchaeaceae archaeon]